ncbi:MAG: GGDEF domain-containing protein [Candidatus Zixiibacteriota bacterium]
MSTEWAHLEATLARWLAADSLDQLCREALQRLRPECGVSRILVLAWWGTRPVTWGMAPDDPLRIPVQRWYDSGRRRSLWTGESDGLETVTRPTAPAGIDPVLLQLGFGAGATMAADAGITYEIFWSLTSDPASAESGSPGTREHRFMGDAIEGEPLWRLLKLALTNQARLERLRELSHIDSVTDIFNRRYFNLRLVEELARAERFERPLALVVADLDRFKHFNDTHGHQVGDMVLRHIGRTVRRAVRSIDILCRLGGDEFAVLMPDTDAAECIMLGERLRQAVEASPLALPGTGDPSVLPMCLSLGGAVYPRHADRAERLLWCADMALLEAKRRGGNQCVCHDELAGKPLPEGCHPPDLPLDCSFPR